ncbi:hypothetical protein LINPERPRIM_LOCUS22423, partial [Linum perenne]
RGEVIIKSPSCGSESLLSTKELLNPQFQSQQQVMAKRSNRERRRIIIYVVVMWWHLVSRSFVCCSTLQPLQHDR